MLVKSVRVLLLSTVLFACKKNSDPDPTPPPVDPPAAFAIRTATVDGVNGSAAPVLYSIRRSPVIRFSFSAPVDKSSVTVSSLSLKAADGTDIAYTPVYSNNDSILTVQPGIILGGASRYKIDAAVSLKSAAGVALSAANSISFVTQIDSSRKFPIISDDDLLTKVQQQTFKYFWDFSHPVSGLARERSNGDNNTCASGGSGFGIMAIITGIERGFITRTQGLDRLRTMVSFLKNTAKTFKGAYPHWINGQTGAALPFSQKDDGADLVETSYLIQGLLCARQYFSGAAAEETTLRADINTISNRVEWDWFRNGNKDVLYWHWSETYNWDMNLPIRGWNECLITYVLAASSTTHSIPASVYNKGWQQDGGAGFVNGGTFYNYRLPLGINNGGPLFFSHYSFMGINPNGLTDQYASYAEQVTNHTLVNYSYCRANPLNQYGYSDSVWGLTASDIPNGYSASSPSNDLGVIAPTAALSSMPYTPAQSMAALKYFYYVLGDKIFKEYGFADAFSLKDTWVADSHLAIDQGPIIVMIENYRTGLLWNLFTSCPEVKTGMKTLGFSAPYLP
ncbi:MAG: beta-glucosidase [Chitinophagaceae bacterium]|nr:MAG: beta-glucosidase [Chitinophagaceae bacterium]